MGEGKSRAHVPAKYGFSGHPHLAAKTSDQIPDLPAIMGERLVQPGWTVLAVRLAGLTVAVAPAEVPVGEGAEPFFSASSSMPQLT